MKHVKERTRRTRNVQAKIDALLRDVCGRPQAFHLMFSEPDSGECNFVTNMPMDNLIKSLREVADRLERSEHRIV